MTNPIKGWRAARAAMLAIAVTACAPVSAPSAPSSSGTPASPGEPAQAIDRSDAEIESEPGIAIAIRRVASARTPLVPVVLVHGAGGGSVASFDVQVPGYSLAEELVRAGHAVYLVEIRGWGNSTKPAVFDQPAEANPPAVTSDQAMRDLGAAIAWVRNREHRPVALLGWATGGHWAGMFAAAHPEGVSHLVIINSLYGTPGAWSMRARLEDAGRPGELSRSIGAYSVRNAAGLLYTWDHSIPVDDKTVWRDPRVASAYAEATIASDPTGATRTPPAARVPAGPLRDSYLLAAGVQMWSATAIRAATLVVRSGLDHWSRPEDVAALRRDLVHTRRVEIVEIPGATHFVFLDRPEHGRARFIEALLGFLARD